MTAWEAPRGLKGYHWRSARPVASLLLQHGYAEHAGRYVDHYNRLIPRLVGEGIDVFAFDMAGHGRSPGARGLTDVRAMVAAHGEARAGLAAEARPLFLFGHSLGGLVTAASVARCPDGIAGVILSGPALPWPVRRRDRLAAALIAAVAPGRSLSPVGDPDGISHLPDEVRAYGEDPLVFRRGLPARLGATALAAAADMWGRLDAWHAPTLVMHGTADRYTDPAGSERLVRGIASADTTLRLVPEGRHELLNDTARDEMLALMLGWIDRHSPIPHARAFGAAGKGHDA